ncbi:4-hydroxythreonine-4-phosphate dehydrogenase PdxA [Paucibacter sp. Y2R2-4]|uniref:4-hydroxythreonine-4-phosphate dehydrogenase PdxA n=1 Tax=Paucibacter sp. Y2R2-4 TaxID=2893553 RepID=UPI0021E3B846|nr:4-hydroxythreonine-4-phosphate dehydrogenase PdxA [Paucibacter sp. Y2R2-4]MCV2349370.1 4-hydroxythreonine-4-phosphate dehydrogenase PdxA [Paucibacter sp. Y2R2-4]
MSTQPGSEILLLTMGDVCGIGPEVLAAALAEEHDPGLCVVGDVGVMRRALQQVGVQMPVLRVEAPADWSADRSLPPHCLPVWQPEGLPADLLTCPLGQIDARAGAAAARCIEAAVGLIQAGHAAGVVTAPIHKEALHAAGVDFPGHTEMLQALASGQEGLLPVRMMLANEELRTVLVTIHCSLRQAIEQISCANVLQTVRIAEAAMRRFGIAKPRIAVAGLNPHAGEGGLFGDEEILHIAPAIALARAEGIDANGPFAPDTVFMRARHAPGHPGAFDLVVAMTHDHGLIPVKYLGVEQGVNVTLGLPFVRTSPDHGTAFDLAGSGRADPSSMRAAIRMARRLLA